MTDGPYKLPEGWRWVRLGEVAQVFAGSSAPQGEHYFRAGRWPFVRVQDLGRYCKTTNLVETADRVNERAVQKCRLKMAKAGTILFPKSGAAILTNSRAILGVDAYIVSHLAALEPVPTALNALWAYYWLCTVDMKDFIANPSYPSLRLTVVKEIPIPLPPLPEQRRIVARIEELMMRVQEARRLRQQAKQDVERLMQSALAEAFPRPGSDLPEGWRWLRLEEVCQQKTGTWGPKASSDQGFPVVRSTEIAGYRIDPATASVRWIPPDVAKRYLLQSGDILVNKSSGSPRLVGWPAIFEDAADSNAYLFSNFMLRLRVRRDQLDSWFLLYYLHSPVTRAIYLGAQRTTSGLRNLQVREFMTQLVPLPPLEEQRRIVTYLDEVQANAKALKKAQGETEVELARLEKSILEKAFRGDL